MGKMRFQVSNLNQFSQFHSWRLVIDSVHFVCFNSIGDKHYEKVHPVVLLKMKFLISRLALSDSLSCVSAPRWIELGTHSFCWKLLIICTQPCDEPDATNVFASEIFCEPSNIAWGPIPGCMKPWVICSLDQIARFVWWKSLNVSVFDVSNIEFLRILYRQYP